MTSTNKSGLDDSEIEGISGLSIRVDPIQNLLNSGTTMPIIIQRGKWTKMETNIRYVEK